MPRGVKGSGDPKTTKAKKPAQVKEPVVEPVAKGFAAYEPIEEKETRKPYPSLDERVALADKEIARLTALKASREALIEKTATVLEERQKALASCVTAIEKAERKKANLVAMANKPPKASKGPKLTPEERKARLAAGRAAKKAEREQAEALMAALRTSGKSVDELLAELSELKG